MGRPWRDFYAWWIDRQERNNSIEKMAAWKPELQGYERGFFDLSRGYYHLEFMKRHGVEPHHRFLDFGCGFGRTAIAVVPYLDKGAYVGVDLSKERIRMAEDWISQEKLSDKAPRFERSSDIHLSYLDDKSFDVVWTQAVISHMPFEDVERFLQAARRVLKDEGVLMFDYVRSEDGFKRHTIKDFFYTEEAIRAAVDRAGFTYSVAADWDDDIVPEKRVKDEVLVIAKPRAV